MKKAKRQQQQQRQKLSRKTILVICAASLASISIGLTVFFNLSHVDKVKAENINVLVVPDQVFTTEKSLAAPAVVQQPTTNQHTIYVKQAKEFQQASIPVTQ